MNNQQAINLLKGLEQSLDDYCELNDEGKTAFGMAITALELFGNAEQLPSAQQDVTDTNVGDMINRQAAISRAVTITMFGRDIRVVGVSELESLPSVQPERKTGHWEIYIISMLDGEGCRCSKCGFEGVPYWDFCPSCGADMREKYERLD